jgi:hypothetical protein
MLLLPMVLPPSTSSLALLSEPKSFEGSNDEFTVKVSEKPEEIKGLLEVGYEYVYQKHNLIFLRKRK